MTVELTFPAVLANINHRGSADEEAPACEVLSKVGHGAQLTSQSTKEGFEILDVSNGAILRDRNAEAQKLCLLGAT